VYKRQVAYIRSEKCGWSSEEVEMLKEFVQRASNEKKSLRWAFDSVAAATGRKSNSIRNYYYTVLRGMMEGDTVVRRKRSEFEVFSHDDIEGLMKFMMIGLANGRSVRSLSLELGDGDNAKMLRYQNKFRSMIASHPDVVRKISTQLEEEGIEHVNPCKNKGEEKFVFTGENAAFETIQELRRITNIDLPAFFSAVNSLYERTSNEDELRRQNTSLRTALKDSQKRESYYKRLYEEIRGKYE
jgi:hypothetical protein